MKLSDMAVAEYAEDGAITMGDMDRHDAERAVRDLIFAWTDWPSRKGEHPYATWCRNNIEFEFESDARDVIGEAIKAEWKRLRGTPCPMVYSGESDMDLDAVPFPGTVIVNVNGDDFWGNGTGFHGKLENPTNMELMIAVADSIEATGDYHHAFFEAWEALDGGDDVTILQPWMGS